MSTEADVPLAPPTQRTRRGRQTSTEADVPLAPPTQRTRRGRQTSTEAEAGAVFEALADPTRRAVLRDVAERGPITATELATRLPVTRQAVAKHLAVLHDAGLVEQERVGRETRFTAQPATLASAGRWLMATGTAWDDRLARLAARADAKGRRRSGPNDLPDW